MRFLCLIAISTLFIHFAHGEFKAFCRTSYYYQTNSEISIKVKDEHGEPIPKATFTNKSRNYSLIFNDEGHLLIKNNPVDLADDLSITCVGYHTLFLKGSDIISSSNVVLILQQKNFELPQLDINKSSLTLQFKKAAELPFSLYFHSTATDSNYLYTIGGQVGSRISRQALKYNPHNNKWSELTNKLIPRIQTQACYIAATNKIYVFGGVKSLRDFQPISYVESIDVNTGETEVLSVVHPFPTAYGGIATWNNKIYLFGGSSNSYSFSKYDDNLYYDCESKIWEFDPINQTFTALPDMPHKLQTTGACVNGILYVFGGYEGQLPSAHNEIYAYNIQSKQWSFTGKLPKNLSANGIAIYKHLIFLTGDYTEENFTGYFNTNTKVFKTIKSNLVYRRHSKSQTIFDHLVVVGGASSGTGMKNMQVASLKEFAAHEN